MPLPVRRNASTAAAYAAWEARQPRGRGRSPAWLRGARFLQRRRGPAHSPEPRRTIQRETGRRERRRKRIPVYGSWALSLNRLFRLDHAETLAKDKPLIAEPYEG